MKTEIKFKQKTLFKLLPFLWIFIMGMWIFNSTSFGFDALKTINIILAALVATLSALNNFLMKKHPYIIINEDNLRIKAHLYKDFKELNIALVSSFVEKKNIYQLKTGLGNVNIAKSHLDAEEQETIKGLFKFLQ